MQNHNHKSSEKLEHPAIVLQILDGAPPMAKKAMRAYIDLLLDGVNTAADRIDHLVHQLQTVVGFMDEVKTCVMPEADQDKATNEAAALLARMTAHKAKGNQS